MSYTGLDLSLDNSNKQSYFDQQQEQYRRHHDEEVEKARQQHEIWITARCPLSEGVLFEAALDECSHSSTIKSVEKIEKIQKIQEAQAEMSMEPEDGEDENLVMPERCQLTISLPNKETIKLAVEQPKPGEMNIALNVSQALGEIMKKVDLAKLAAGASRVIGSTISLDIIVD